MTDSNKNLTLRAIVLLAELGRAMGPPIERAARQVTGSALACLSDKKKPVWNHSLQACGAHAGLLVYCRACHVWGLP